MGKESWSKLGIQKYTNFIFKSAFTLDSVLLHPQ